MYLVQVFDGPSDPTGITIHSPYVNGAKLSTGQITLKLSGVDEFSFSFNPQNPGYRKIKPLFSLVKITDVRTGELIFSGRVLEPTYNMESSGLFIDEYICESKLAYLQDSTQRFAEIHDTTIRDFFAILITRHNETVEAHKRFKVGNVTVTNSTDNVYRFVDYLKTYPTIKEKLLDRLGGFLVLREEADGTYIDYLASVGESSQTAISLRKNLKSISRGIDPTEIITRLVPLGARLDEGSTSDSKPRLTIASVNGGVDYIDDLALQSEFGIIEGTVIWDDVTLPDNLRTKGAEFLANQKAAIETFDISAVDLSLIGLAVDGFNVGDWYVIDNPYIADEEPLQIIEKVIDIGAPQQSKLTFGEKSRTLTQYQTSAINIASNVGNLSEQISTQTTRIGELSAELAQAQSDLEATKLSLEQFEGGTEEGMAEINAAIVSINDTIADLETLIAELESVVTEEEITQMKTDIATNTSGLDDVNLLLADLTVRVEALENAEGGTV